MSCSGRMSRCFISSSFVEKKRQKYGTKINWNYVIESVMRARYTEMVSIACMLSLFSPIRTSLLLQPQRHTYTHAYTTYASTVVAALNALNTLSEFGKHVCQIRYSESRCWDENPRGDSKFKRFKNRIETLSRHTLHQHIFGYPIRIVFPLIPCALSPLILSILHLFIHFKYGMLAAVLCLLLFASHHYSTSLPNIILPSSHPPFQIYVAYGLRNSKHLFTATFTCELFSVCESLRSSDTFSSIHNSVVAVCIGHGKLKLTEETAAERHILARKS